MVMLLIGYRLLVIGYWLLVIEGPALHAPHIALRLCGVNCATELLPLPGLLKEAFYSIFNIQHSAFSIQHSAFNIQHSSFSIHHPSRGWW
jgi:hypothetical protein